MREFAIALYQEPGHLASLDLAEIREILGEMIEWRKGIEERGLFSSGFKLTEEPGRVIVHANKNEEAFVVDGPYAEIKELLGGLLIVKAKDYDDAVALAMSNPFTRFAGRMEVRMLDKDYIPGGL